jgi:hypothetical protein
MRDRTIRPTTFHPLQLRMLAADIHRAAATDSQSENMCSILYV